MGVAVAAVATFVLPNGEEGLQGVGGVVVLHGEGVAVGGAGGLALQPEPGFESFTFQNTPPPPPPKKKQNHPHYLQNSEAKRYGSQYW